MAITLEEAKVGMADHVDQLVIDTFQRSSLLMDRMTFDNAVSPGTGGSTLVYGYTQLKTPATAGTRALNAEYAANEAKRKKLTAELAIMGGSFKVDRVLQNTSGAIDELDFQLQQKIKATANEFHYNAINGVKGTSFDGLKTLLTGASTNIDSEVNISTAALMDSNAQAFLDEVDNFLSLIDGANILMMNTSMLTKFRGIARRVGYYERTKNDAGRVIETYNGIPMVDLGKYFNGSASVDCIETSSNGFTSIYAASLGMDGFHGITPVGNDFIKAYMPDMNAPGAVKTGEVEFVGGVALKSTLKAGVLNHIQIEQGIG